MRIIRFSSDLHFERPTAVAIGNFDGVHRGHQKLISKLIEDSKSLGLTSVVCSFEPLSWQLFTNTSCRLTNLRTKLDLIHQQDIDVFLVVNFTHPFSRLSHGAFIKDFLVSQLNASHIITGEDFHFGADRNGGQQQLEQAQLSGLFSYAPVKDYPNSSAKISSSIIREFMGKGELTKANEYLGYPYYIIGRVVKGSGIGGSKLATPTANLNLKGFIPPLRGVFACWVEVLDADAGWDAGIDVGGDIGIDVGGDVGIDVGGDVGIDVGGDVAGAEVVTKRLPAVANLGVRPTVGGNRFNVEVHILNFNLDLYGKSIKLEFVERIREEKKFSGLEELKQQIARDKKKAQGILL